MTTLTLDEVRQAIGASVVHPGSFASLGFLTHRWSERLCFVESLQGVGQLTDRSDIACVLTTAALASQVPDGLGVAVVASPRDAFAALHEYLARETAFYGKTGATYIDPSARVHERAWVSPNGVHIGPQVFVEPNATLLSGVEVGAGSVIRAGVVVGSEGFQATVSDGRVRRWIHTGRVTIGANVELQSNTCVDRALFGGATAIGDDSTIDKLVYIAHHVVMGPRCRVGAGACVTGSVTIGADAWIGPNATIRDGLTIGDGAQVSLGSVVTMDVPAHARVTGNFAVDHAEFMRPYRNRA